MRPRVNSQTATYNGNEDATTDRRIPVTNATKSTGRGLGEKHVPDTLRMITPVRLAQRWQHAEQTSKSRLTM